MARRVGGPPRLREQPILRRRGRGSTLRCVAGATLRAAIAGVLVALGGQARALDLALYARMLDQHTVAVADVASTRVDYASLRASAEWSALARSLSEFDPGGLRSRAEALACWINAYNVPAIDLVQRGYPTASVRSLGGLLSPVWRQPAGRIGSHSVTLDHIEHRILRPLGDPRKGLAVDRAARAVYLSRIFAWFAEDFGDDVLSFVAGHAPAESAAWIREHRDALRVRYFDYHWRLNDAAAAPR